MRIWPAYMACSRIELLHSDAFYILLSAATEHVAMA